MRTYRRRREIIGDDLFDDVDGRLTFRPWEFPDRPPVRDLRVAVIADDFTRLALGYEWQQLEVTPDDWRGRLLDGQGRPQVDLLFVESAWHGNDDAWQYHLTGSSAPRPALVELVTGMREAGVPTVFWNKEDPAHYADFLDTARLFDQVFTTDVNKLDDYRRDLDHDRVGVLPFAVQPVIHNPIRPRRGHAARDIGFGGMYFAHKYPERRAQMDLLLGAADRVSARMEHGLEIFSRYLGHDERYQFPAPLDQRVVGSLDYRQMLTAYRAYKVFLNVNSVVDSPSMCARRVFEISACGTPVVSTPSPAISEFFPADEVVQVEESTEAELALRALVRSPELRDRMVHKAQRHIWSEHTYGHRVEQVLGSVGLPGSEAALPTVSALVSTIRPQQLDHILRTVAGFTGVQVQLCLLTHGHTAPDDLHERAAALGVTDLKVVEAPAERTLGECLNQLVAMADGEVLTKIDDDDEYGANYLLDLLYAIRYSGAEVVGKQAHYVRLGESGTTAIRFGDREHRFTDFVMGPTLTARAEVFRAHPFESRSTGEDTAFLRDVADAGGRIYAADRFNFVQQRGEGGHTWQAADVELLASATVVSGDPLA
ncbi:glycosyltransferase family protein [Naumannella halotolerans]|uniref:glycosyltransferase family protein n=1 Tax=Naumannella halotolerans TaxID=993414 RepID=UPI001AAEB86B|nr:glycosyltransferase [Naumannella halotolerans]